MSVLFRWPCSTSIHLQHFYSFVSQVCHWWCPPFSAGHAAFLFICPPGLSLLVRPFPLAIHWCRPFSCLPGLSLLVSALFRWPCSISIHLSPRFVLLVSALFRWQCNISIHLSLRSVTGGVRPLPLAMQHVYSFVSQVAFSLGHVACLIICLRGVSLLVSALFRWRCNISIHSTNSVPLRRVSQFFLKKCPPFLSLLVSAHFRWPCRISNRFSLK